VQQDLLGGGGISYKNHQSFPGDTAISSAIMVSRITNGRSLMVRLNLCILAVAAAPEVPQMDLDRAAAQADLYPTRAWACVGGFIAFVSLCHLFSLLSLLWRHVPPDSAASRNRDVIHIRRLPTALVHTFRVIAFRWTISLGDSFTLNLAELFMTAGYIAILFSWALVNCKSHLMLLLVIGGLILCSK
jgi:hypothetical protein